MSLKNEGWVAKVRTIQRNGLLLIPRVTDMRNGSYRPEVVYSNGRHSDIFFGDTHVNRFRCATIAEQSIASAILMTEGSGGFWDEPLRALENIKRVAGRLAAIF